MSNIQMISADFSGDAAIMNLFSLCKWLKLTRGLTNLVFILKLGVLAVC